MKLRSDFAILDVTKGRNALRKHFINRPAVGPCPKELRIPVTITGFLVGQFGGDDGTSIEFEVAVEKLKIKEQQP